MKRRVLVVAYYFPPSGGPGVQRVLKFVKYLREFGYEPIVLTVEEGAYPQHDEALASEIPSDIAVHRTRSIDPFGLYARLTGRSRKEAVMVGSVKREGGLVEKFASWIRANIFLPDARVGWVPFAVREGLRLHHAQPFDAILTSGPPHSVHLIGRGLKRKTGVSWVADFRDLWSDTNYSDALPASTYAKRRDERFEQSVLGEANHLVTVSPFWRSVLLEKSGRKEDAISVVHNGFDEADFADRPSKDSTASVFKLAHVGSLYASRNPLALWEALRQIREEGRGEHLRVRLIGMVDESVRASIVENGLESIVEVVPYVSHSEAIDAMCGAAALLLVVEPFRNDSGMITGKLYEYLAAGRPVVGIGPPVGDAADLLVSTTAGKMIGRDDAEGIRLHLLTLYQAWARGEKLRGATINEVQDYSRREQTGVLASIIDSTL